MSDNDPTVEARSLIQWFNDKRGRNYGALEEHTNIFYNMFTALIGPDEAAKKLNAQLASSKTPDAGWRARQLLFAAAAELPWSHSSLVELVHATLQTPPEAENSKSLDLGLWSEWGDFHSYLWGRRGLPLNDSDDLRATDRELSNSERAIDFTSFSAKVLRLGVGKSEIGSMAFFDIRSTLENSYEEPSLPSHSIVTPEQLKAIEIEISAQWILYGEEAVLQLSNEDLGEAWAEGLAVKTELWHGKAGFSEDRWKLWKERFLNLAGLDNDSVPQSTKDAAHRAAEQIRT
ncbi:hypothetical protein K431DRAFT_284893 [Polychaeton citri CBS 116435]|uniref:Uncharacterized protein n=1 Tax=Polychaeton citri CBS 116435 TaxID=1314669 RepID=A0A9P4UQY4_9PEZI|nr:hypothetical protein K431DRAFT_284893 [Polychaeton citri CBS 116435]